VNNKGFPHNVVFDEDNIPAGVSADALSHEDYLNVRPAPCRVFVSVCTRKPYLCLPD
jgi:plastocyanin